MLLVGNKGHRRDDA